MSEQLRKRYAVALHRMQAGVSLLMNNPAGLRNEETEPKHLRVGINSCLVDGSAIASLLIKKGLFTEAEYFEAVTVAAEDEAERYQVMVQRIYGPHVTLGSDDAIRGGDS